MISDIHCPIHLIFSCKDKPAPLIAESDNLSIKPKWIRDNSVKFSNHLDDEEIEILNQKLDTLDFDLVDQDIVENLVDDCCKIMKVAASSSEMLKIYNKKK